MNLVTGGLVPTKGLRTEVRTSDAGVQAAGDLELRLKKDFTQIQLSRPRTRPQTTPLPSDDKFRGMYVSLSGGLEDCESFSVKGS